MGNRPSRPSRPSRQEISDLGVRAPRWSDTQPRFAGFDSSYMPPGYMSPGDRNRMDELHGGNVMNYPRMSPGGYQDAVDKSEWFDRNMSQSDYEQHMHEIHSARGPLPRGGGQYAGPNTPTMIRLNEERRKKKKDEIDKVTRERGGDPSIDGPRYSLGAFR